MSNFKILPIFIWLVLIFFLGKIASDRILHPSGADLVGKQLRKIVTNPIKNYPPIPDNLKTLPNDLILLNFFASWCAPCKQEHPELLRLSRDYKLHIIGVVTRDSTKRVADFLLESGNPYDYLGLDKNDITMINFRLKGVPETYLLNKDGEVLAFHSGILTKEVVENKFMRYLTPIGK